MFEKEINTIFETVKQRVLHRGTSSSLVSVKDIFAADIPYSIKNFFRTNVELLLEEELLRARKSSRFDYTHPEVQNLQLQMNSILIMNFNISTDEFVHQLNDAIHLIVNFFVRPQWTLKSFLFENEHSISRNSLSRLLKYFSAYDYLKDLIVRYVKEKGMEKISKDDFSDLIWRLDGEYIRRKSGDELARIMSPMFDFLDFPMNSDVKKISTKGLIKFFEDKGLMSVVIRLEGEIAQGNLELSQHTLGEILEDVRRTSGAFSVEKPAEEELKKQVKDVEDAQLHPTEVLHEPSTNRHLAKSTISLLSFMSESDRKKFIKKIFKYDEQKFLTSIRKIESIPTWKQSSSYIDEIFIEYDIDPYSSEAKRFMDVIFQWYYPKSS